MPIKSYSTTANSNVSAPPNGFPIGTTKVSQYDDVGRQIMADVRSFYEAPQWRDLGHTPTFASSTSFRVAGDLTAFYRTNQRIKINDSSTLYGTIASATFGSPNTTITVTMDSGSITSSITSVELGLSPDNDPIHVAALAGTIADANLPSSVIQPVGMVVPYAGSSAPSGWLLCRGQAVSRTTFASLFAVISTTYGAGDGSTTFNVPDIGGRVVAGLEASATRLTSGVSGVNGGTLGASGGNQNMHQHNHTITDSGHSHVGGLQAVTAGVTRRYGTTDTGISSSHVDSGASSSGTTGTNTSTSTTGISLANAGTGSSQNVQPTIVLNYIIRA